MDFITQLPSSRGKNCNPSSSWLVEQICSFHSPFSWIHTKSVAKIFVREICTLDGFPKTIFCDRDQTFMSKFWQEFFQLQGYRIAASNAYHPHTDGQTKVVNRVLKDYLRCYVAEDQHNWIDMLAWGEYSYNTAHQSLIEMSPFEAYMAIYHHRS